MTTLLKFFNKAFGVNTNFHKKYQMYFLLFSDIVLQSIFFGFSSLFVSHIYSFNLSVEKAIFCINLLRISFFSSMFFTLFNIKFPILFTVRFMILMASCIQVCLMFFSNNFILFLFFSLFFVFIIGFCKPSIMYLTFNKLEDLSEKKKVVLFVYIGINISALLFEFSAPFLYKTLSFSGSIFFVFISLLIASLALFYVDYSDVHFDSEVSKKFSDFMKNSILGFFGNIFRLKNKTKYSSEFNSEAVNSEVHDLFVFLTTTSLFYAAFDQIFGVALAHTRKMNLSFYNITLFAGHLQLINPIVVILFSKFFTNLVSKKSLVFRFRFGCFIVAFAFAIMMLLDYINLNVKSLSALFDLIPYFLLTIGEIFVYTFGAEKTLIYLREEFKLFGFVLFCISGVFGNLLFLFFSYILNMIVHFDNLHFFALAIFFALASAFLSLLFNDSVSSKRNV